ncbi:MAG: PLDc N-terminal domain-containing protein, partial [Planctomycetota bacterium]
MLTSAAVVDNVSWFTVLVFIADWLIRIGLSVRVIMRRTGVGESLSWLSIVLVVPFVGAAIYLIVGENRLGSRRAKRTRRLYNAHAGWRSKLRDRAGDPADLIPPAGVAIHRQALRMVGVPAVPGNRLQLLTDSHAALRALAADIDAATQRCHLEFYIWFTGGKVDDDDHGEVFEPICDGLDDGP